MSQSYNTLLFEQDENGVAIITVNRPDKLNALNDQVLNELADVFKKINVDESIRGVIVKGAGEKAFVAGADIGELKELDKRSGWMKSQKGQQIFQSIEDTRKPVLALVNGYALGGGAELALACHIRIATEKAVFGFPEVGLGLIPGYGGTQRLSHIAGRAKALEMILTGKHISAEEAREYRLVNMIVPEASAMDDTKEFLDSILKNGPLAIQEALRAIYHSDDKHGFQIEADLFGYLCSTKDSEEGLSAFLEKRKPEFKGK